MKKAAKKKGGSKAGRKNASTSSARKNDEAMVETEEAATQETQPSQEAEETAVKVDATQETQPSQEAEETAVKVEGENEEEAEEDQEEKNEEAKPDSATQQDKDESESQNDEPKENQEEENEEAKPDSTTHQEKDETASKKNDAKGASSSQPELRRGKRKRVTKNESEKKEGKNPAPRAKRARTSKTKPQDAEPEYFVEKRNLEDLWKAAFPVGTEWGQLDALYEFNWNFKNLEEALEEGGQLHGKNVYVFGCTESQLVPYKNENKTVLVPAVVCIESSIPPSDKIGVAPVQEEVEQIIPMKTMKMAWVPYIPLEKRDKQVDRMNFQINILGCTQRKSALKHLKEDRVNKFNSCLPYINNPFKEYASENNTVVQITFPSEPPVECEYDWAQNNIEGFTDNLIKEEALLPEQKDGFMEFVKEQSDKAETANEEAKEAREKAKEGLSEETQNAYKEMKLYKFYPLPSPDTPEAAKIKKSPFINKYFGNAHEVI